MHNTIYIKKSLILLANCDGFRLINDRLSCLFNPPRLWIKCFSAQVTINVEKYFFPTASCFFFLVRHEILSRLFSLYVRFRAFNNCVSDNAAHYSFKSFRNNFETKRANAPRSLISHHNYTSCILDTFYIAAFTNRQQVKVDYSLTIVVAARSSAMVVIDALYGELCKLRASK